RRVKEDHVARRVARAVTHLERLLAERHRVAVFEPAIGLEGGKVRKPEHLSLAGELLDPEPVLALWSLDRHPVALRELAGLPAMVDVTVREEHLLEGRALAAKGRFDTVEVAAGIDRDRLAGVLAHQHRTVLHERRDGNDQE